MHSDLHCPSEPQWHRQRKNTIPVFLRPMQFWSADLHIRRRRSLQRICSVEGLGAFPTSWKTPLPKKSETVFFRIWRAICLACQFSVSNHLYSFFCRNHWKRNTRKQCICGHKCEKRPNRYLRNGRFFKLVEAPPQSPANTKCVLEHSPSDRGYTILRIAISHNMNPVGFLLVFVHRLQAALRSFSNAESSS